MQNSCLLYLLIVACMLSACSSNRNIASQPSQKNTLTVEAQKQRDYYFYEALRKKELRQYDEAIEMLLLCEAIDPDDAGIQAELGMMYASIGLNEQAVACMENAVRKQPANWWHNVRLISFYSDLARWDKAIECANVLQKHYPHREDVYSILATIYTQKDDAAKAIAAYDKLENFTGINEQLSLEKFRLYLLLDNEKKAVTEIERLVNKYPSESRYRVLQGNIYMHLKQREKAFALFQEVLSSDPQNPYVYLALSEYYASENESEKALEAIEKALKSQFLDIDTKVEILGGYIEETIRDSTKLDGTESLLKLLVENYPLEEKVHAFYAVFLQYRERNDEVIEILETMLDINPKNEQTWGEMMQIHLAGENYDQLLLVTQRAIEQLPEVPQWYFFRGTAYYLLNDYRQAIGVYTKGIELAPENVAFKSSFYSQMADAYFKLEENEKAFEAYEKALEINPSNIYVLNNYAYYLSVEKMDLKKAERMSARTVEKEPHNATYLDTYAWIFYQQGNYTLAKFYIERAIDNMNKEEENGVIIEHYGDILWMMKDDEKALEMWQKADESGGGSDELKQKIENKGWERE